MNILVFKNDNNLEKNILAVTKQIALDFGIQLASKYAVDGEIELIVNGDFNNIEKRDIEIEIVRVDGKAVVSHSINVELDYDDDDNEFVKLDFTCYKSTDKNKVRQLQSVENSQWSKLIVTTQDNIVSVAKIAASVNKKKDDETQAKYDANSHRYFNIPSVGTAFALEELEDRLDLSPDEIREMAYNDPSLLENL